MILHYFLHFLPHGEIRHLITVYGYAAVGGIIALESMGIPILPGETTLIVAGIVAGTTHALNVWFVVASAAAGAIVGYIIGYWIGLELGFWLAVHYGRYIRLTEARLKLGQYLFIRHGGKVVFFGRFVPVLRAFAALLAGVDCMGWPRFFVFNVAGAIVWAAIYGFGAWYLGKKIITVAGPAGIALGITAVIVIVAGYLFFRHHEAQLEAQAERALPGPLRREHDRTDSRSLS